MSKKKSPSLPDAPTFQPDPFVGKSQEGLFETGDALRKGLFLNENDPTVGFLNQLVSLNPELTQAAIGLASRPVIDAQERAFQDTINQLEANNQLTSSVTADSLGKLNKSFSRDLSDISTRFNLADLERAMGNIGGLFETGLGTLSDVGNRALSNQGQVNQFNLANYENQVAKALYDQQNSGGRGGLGGALQGAVGGGMTGFMVGGPIGALVGAGVGGAAGGFGPQGTGQQLATLGSLSGSFGGGGFGGLGGPLPGSSATNSLRGLSSLNSRSIGLSSGNSMQDRMLFGLGTNIIG